MKISDSFHKYYDENKLWSQTTWLGLPCWKLPFDAWVVQEIILEVSPRYIIETGTGLGGSALFYASILELKGQEAEVLTVDIDDKHKKYVEQLPLNSPGKRIWEKRVKFIHGSSTDYLVFEDILNYSFKAFYAPVREYPCIVCLDSWHTKEHVLKELEMYSSLVKTGGYIIVEDTHVNGNPIDWEWGAGPMEAVDEFLGYSDDFVRDDSKEKFIMTFNPNGFLKRVRRSYEQDSSF